MKLQKPVTFGYANAIELGVSAMIPADDPAELVGQEDITRRIRDWIDGCHPNDQVVLSTVTEDITLAEAAVTLGIDPSTVARRRDRLLKRARHTLAVIRA